MVDLYFDSSMLSAGNDIQLIVGKALHCISMKAWIK
jgi:hypothetical protein